MSYLNSVEEVAYREANCREGGIDEVRHFFTLLSSPERSSHRSFSKPEPVLRITDIVLVSSERHLLFPFQEFDTNDLVGEWCRAV